MVKGWEILFQSQAPSLQLRGWGKKLRFKLREEPKTTEKAPAEETNKTQRNRFPLIKKSKAKENELIEKLFASINLKNEVHVDKKENQWPFIFRSSISRDQLRKKAEIAIKPKSIRPINPRKQQTTTTETLTTTAEILELKPAETTEAPVVESIEVREEKFGSQPITRKY